MRSTAAALCVVLFLSGVARGDELPEISLGKDTQKVVVIAGLQRYSVDAPTKCVEVRRIDANQLFLNGLSAGKATVTVWDKKGKRSFFRVTVRHIDL